MKLVKNEYNIKQNIKYRGTYTGYCILGKKDFTCMVEIEIKPNDYVPEYCSMEKDIKNVFRRSEGTTVERCAREIYNMFKQNGFNASVRLVTLSGAHQTVEVIVNE